MDFDKLKNQWKEVKISDQSSALNEERLTKITSKKYRSNYFKIFIPEFLLACLFLFGIVFFIAFFKHFSPGIHSYLAILTIFLLVLIPGLSLFSIFQYYKAGSLDSPIGTTLINLRSKGHQFIHIQKVLLLLKVALFSICVILVPLVYSENPTTKEIIISILIGALIISFFSFKLWKFYKRKINYIESLLLNLS